MKWQKTLGLDLIVHINEEGLEQASIRPTKLPNIRRSGIDTIACAPAQAVELIMKRLTKPVFCVTGSED